MAMSCCPTFLTVQFPCVYDTGLSPVFTPPIIKDSAKKRYLFNITWI